MNILKYEVGNIVTRTERAPIAHGTDGSYIGDRMMITRMGDTFCEILFIDGYLKGRNNIFADKWLEGWEKLSDSLLDELRSRERSIKGML